MIQYLCKNCGQSFSRYNSLQTKCNLCAYNRHAKPKKPMKRIGPVTKKWIAARKQWLDDNPSKDGLYLCYLCDKELTLDELSLDHITARSRDPSLRNEQSNLAPCCWPCNQAKGSLSLEEYAAKLV